MPGSYSFFSKLLSNFKVIQCSYQKYDTGKASVIPSLSLKSYTTCLIFLSLKRNEKQIENSNPQCCAVCSIFLTFQKYQSKQQCKQLDSTTVPFALFVFEDIRSPLYNSEGKTLIKSTTQLRRAKGFSSNKDCTTDSKCT